MTRKFTVQEQERGRTVPVFAHHRFEARQVFADGSLVGFRVCRGHGPRLEVLREFPFERYATREDKTLTEVLAKDMAAMANKLLD